MSQLKYYNSLTSAWEPAIVGAQGATGATGPQGNIGATGASGIQGFDGATGPQGFDGATGPIGDAGATGPQGFDGATGPQGDAGATGPQGQIGSTGASGVQGLTGATGQFGATGSQGFEGSTGPQGFTGSTGPIGITGATGLTGATGGQGVQGYDGSTGATGPQGSTGVGLQGSTGAQGATGLAGQDGGSSTYYNYAALTTATSGDPGNGNILWNTAIQTNASQLNIDHLTTTNVDIDVFLALLKINDSLIVQDSTSSTNYQRWTINGTPTSPGDNLYWTVPVSLQSSAGTGTTGFSNGQSLLLIVISTGQQGATGLAGATGLTGATGQFGATGASGLTGATGFDGATGASGITGLTGSTGVQGFVGATGAQGDKGATGVAGATGAFDGNLTANIDGNGYNISNVNVVTTNIIANPKTITANVLVPNDVNALVIGPVVFSNGAMAIVPSSSTFDVFDPAALGGTMTANINGAGYNISNVSFISATGNISGDYFVGNGSLLTGIASGNANAIVNGNSNVTINTANGNVTVAIDGQGNVVEIGQGSLNVAGTISNPKTITANVYVPDNVNALMIGPVSFANGAMAVVPASSTFDVFDPAALGGTMTSNIDGAGYGISNIGSLSSTGNISGVGALNIEGVLSNPKTITANVYVPDSVNALMIGPVTFANGSQAIVPGNSTFDIFDPAALGGTMTSNIDGAGYNISNVSNVSSNLNFVTNGISLLANQVTANVTFPANYNGMSVGPLTVATGIAVNVGTNNWVIL